MELDVLVVGAGPAGAAVSILLARHGYRVLLVDRATFPRDKACAEYLSPVCTPLLAHLGVLGEGFFDPFTGQGIYLALHSATLAAAVAHRALCSDDLSARHLRSYVLAHRQAFRDKYRLSALMQLGLRVPWLAHHVIDRLDGAFLAFCRAGLGVKYDVKWRRSRSFDEWNGFVDEHDGDIIPNGIEIPPIFTHQATVDGLCHRCATAVGELSLTYTIIETRQQGGVN